MYDLLKQLVGIIKKNVVNITTLQVEMSESLSCSSSFDMASDPFHDHQLEDQNMLQ